MLERHKVQLTTDGGAATGYTPALRGRLQSIVYVKTDFADGVDVTITEEDTAQAILTLTDQNVAGRWQPRLPTHDTVGVASLYAGAGEPVEDCIPVQGRVKIVVASGGATKSGTFYVYVSGN
jgi:hypothetical protein